MRVLLIMVQSIDGFITKHDEPGAGFASKEDQQHLRNILSSCDASIMGAATFRLHQNAIVAKTPNRLRLIWTRNPAEYSSWEKHGMLEFSNLSAAELHTQLAARGLRRVALLGGAAVYDAFLKAGLVDEIWTTIEPIAFGEGLKPFQGKLEARYHLVSNRRLNDSTVLLQYSREPRRTWRQTMRDIGLGFAVTVGLCAAGGLLGAVAFPLFAAVFLQHPNYVDLALLGAKKISFITLIWAPGAAAILLVMKRYREAQAKKRS